MTYEIIERNKKHVDAIVKALKKADALYLATDPDREGEAISWHLYELLKEQKALEGKEVHRVDFYEFHQESYSKGSSQSKKVIRTFNKSSTNSPSPGLPGWI